MLQNCVVNIAKVGIKYSIIQVTKFNILELICLELFENISTAILEHVYNFDIFAVFEVILQFSMEKILWHWLTSTHPL